MKNYALAALVFTVLCTVLNACRKNVKEEGPRDYDGVRQRSEEQHKSLDSQN